jgi:hypothetical protein
MREINTGRGISRTSRSVADIAADRAARLDNWGDQQLFLSTFDRVRQVAPKLAHIPLDLEMICVELTRNSSVMEAAMIEALASLRADGVRL